jgi:hypothetical protein
MKIRRSIIWFVVIIAGLIALILWHRKEKSAETPTTIAIETNAALPTITVKNPSASTPSHTNASITRVSPNKPIPIAVGSEEQQMREGLAKFNDQDIFLYARVIDQFDAPVPGATVSAVIGVNNGTRVGQDKTSTVTDENGFFTISGYKGKDMGVNVSKSGYVADSTNSYFVYSLLWPAARRFTPNPNNPIIIKMWKLQGVEPLVGIDKQYKLSFTKEPLFFDFIRGTVSDSGGDLEVVVTRASGSLSKKNPGDWSISLVPINGGIIEPPYNTSYLTFEAPGDGYLDNYLVQMNRNDPAWFDNIQKEFFLKSRDGQVYSKFSFDFRINNDPNGLMWFQFRGVANTNGSRNWEATAPQSQ